jgi:hypothetical protein
VHRRGVSLVAAAVDDVMMARSDVLGVRRWLVVRGGELEGVEIAKAETRVG